MAELRRREWTGPCVWVVAVIEIDWTEATHGGRFERVLDRESDVNTEFSTCQ